MQPNMPNMLALMQEYYAQISMNNAVSLLGVGSAPVTPSTNGSAFNAVTKPTRYASTARIPFLCERFSSLLFLFMYFSKHTKCTFHCLF